MKKVAPLVALALALVLAACAPAVETLQSEELISPVSYESAFATALNTINTQPYPSNRGGWVVTSSDQVGGFIAAEMSWEVCNLFRTECRQRTARVSITLNDRGATTAVGIGHTNDVEAENLATRLSLRLTGES